MAYTKDGYRITRNLCPRNCYDTCGILAYTRKGILEKIEGDPLHGYTRGKLCAKGYTYIKQVYSDRRIRSPLRQIGRGSGRWEAITWEAAMEIICHKILELKERYNSTLPLCLNKYSGNFGILHYAVEGMFNSLGAVTRTGGSPCWPAGLDAQIYDLGKNINSDISEITKAKLIILWGVNPAFTAVHSLSYIYQAKEEGAKVIVIDPVFTQTAQKADYYVQIKPGTDGALALALAKIMLEKGLADKKFVKNHTFGYEPFENYLKSLDLAYLSRECGQDAGNMEEIARLIFANDPVFIWVGFGLQRHLNGGQNIRAIDALAAMRGLFGKSGGGVHYANNFLGKFPLHFLKENFKNRYLNINKFASELKNLKEELPVKMLWVACRNLVSQDAASLNILEEMAKIELIVTVDQFMTSTARYSDIVLPATTHFEELDVVPSYWHHYLGINEQAISPRYEAKSDLEIARLLSETLNKYQPGSSNFPVDKSPEQFLDEEFTAEIYSLLGINHWTELEEAPRRFKVTYTAWQDKIFATPSGKFEFFSAKAQKAQLPAMAEYREGAQPNKKYPYWLITSHSQQGLNSQFQNLEAFGRNSLPKVYIHPESAKAKNVTTGSLVKVYNEQASLILKACISNDVPPDVLLCPQQLFSQLESSLNNLVKGELTDMGEFSSNFKGLAFYNVFVDFTGDFAAASFSAEGGF